MCVCVSVLEELNCRKIKRSRIKEPMRDIASRANVPLSYRRIAALQVGTPKSPPRDQLFLTIATPLLVSVAVLE